jgi:hypothetical protein
MAIRQIDGGQSFLTPPQRKMKEEESAQEDFQKILQKAHSNLQGAFPANGAASVSEPEDISSHFLAAVQPSNSAEKLPEIASLLSMRTQSTKAAEETLDLLENYCKAIADPGLSLKEINPLLKSLQDKIDGLTQQYEKLPLADPLRDILSEVGILSSVEIERFHRGDYTI